MGVLSVNRSSTGIQLYVVLWMYHMQSLMYFSMPISYASVQVVTQCSVCVCLLRYKVSTVLCWVHNWLIQ